MLKVRKHSDSLSRFQPFHGQAESIWCNHFQFFLYVPLRSSLIVFGVLGFFLDRIYVHFVSPCLITEGHPSLKTRLTFVSQQNTISHFHNLMWRWAVISANDIYLRSYAAHWVVLEQKYFFPPLVLGAPQHRLRPGHLPTSKTTTALIGHQLRDILENLIPIHAMYLPLGSLTFYRANKIRSSSENCIIALLVAFIISFVEDTVAVARFSEWQVWIFCELICLNFLPN